MIYSQISKMDTWLSLSLC